MQIKLENLKKSYITLEGNTITPVNDISLTIPENKIFGIIGKSGAGKSSLVRLISLLEKPDSGHVYYNDKPVENLSKKDLIQQRRKLGMIFQNFNLFSSRTAAKNIAYPLEIAHAPKALIKERVQEMLELVGLEDKANAAVSTLSGGQKQRVAIARALATRPDILFCDEATSALDPQTTRSILSLIREIQKKMNLTVIMITHQMEVVRDACSEVAVVDNGIIVEQGLVKDIFSKPKHPVTKEFLSHLTQQDEEEKLVRFSHEGGKYKLYFVGQSTDEPLLSEIVQKFNVKLNIRAAGISNLTDTKVGTMITDISGTETDVKNALEYLKEHGVNGEECNE